MTRFDLPVQSPTDMNRKMAAGTLESKETPTAVLEALSAASLPSSTTEALGPGEGMTLQELRRHAIAKVSHWQYVKTHPCTYLHSNVSAYMYAVVRYSNASCVWPDWAYMRML